MSSKIKNDIYAINFENCRRTSRESKIVNEIAKKVDIDLFIDKCDVSKFDISFYEKMFESCEVLSFPEWYYLAQKYKNAGIKAITSGNLGEIIGGHYAFTFLGTP